MSISIRSGLAFALFAKSVERWIRKRPAARLQRKRRARQRFLEQLEPRNLMALDILSVSPVDGSIDWTPATNLTITFNGPVVKGQGNIHVVRETTSALGVAVDVTSDNVTVAGATVTVDLPTDLTAGEAYYVLIDNGAFLETASAPALRATLLAQDFELLPLNPFETVGGGDGTDFTKVPPLNYVVDNSLMPTGGTPEYQGWTFIDKNSWIREAGDQARSNFTRGVGTIAVGDPDQFDDDPNGGPFNGRFLSRPISLSGVTADSVVLEFDSSFRPENTQIGILQVRFDLASDSWTDLLTLNPTNTSNQTPGGAVTAVNLNERLVSGTSTGVSSNGRGNVPFARVVNPAGASSMQFRWGVAGGNTWWWGIDNLRVTGQVTRTPFLGLSNRTLWNLDIPRFASSVDKTSMSENGGTAVGTVSRNGSTANPLVVTLTSSDTTEATVPPTVTIPAGASFITFPITAVDDLISDRAQRVTVTLTAPTWQPTSISIDVTDDEGPKIVTLTPSDNSSGIGYTSSLAITFDRDIKPGSGSLHILRSSDSRLITSVEVNSASVTILPASANILTIVLPVNLIGLTGYSVLIDDGAIVDTSTTVTPDAMLLEQDFELLNLAPFASRVSIDGTDTTKKPPQGFNIDNTGVVGGATSSDYFGWSFQDKNSWIATSGGAGRTNFALGRGVVAVADASLLTGVTNYNSFVETRLISLTGVTAGTLAIEFDLNFNSGLPRLGVVQVSTNGGGWVDFLQISQDVSNTRAIYRNGVVSGAGVSLLAPYNNPSSGNVRFRFGLTNTGAAGWLSVDNINVFGQIQGLPYLGHKDPTVWNFTTSAVDDLPIASTFLPLDNATAVPVESNLAVTFNQPVKKGNGFVHIVRSSDGKLGVSVDVQSPLVTVVGSVVTINPPIDLVGLTDYFVQFDSGALLSNTTSPTERTVLLSEDFELLPLGPAVFETVGTDGTDFTIVPPQGFAVDNSLMPPGGVPEWNGWTFAAKSFWETQGQQNRANFTRGSGTIAVGEVDEWDDNSTLNNSFNGLFLTSPINLANTAANSVVLEFDSSFRPENSPIANNQVGIVEVSYNGGSWERLLTLDRNNTSGEATASNVNERRFVGMTNPTTGTARFRFGVSGTNDYWWAIDNILITADVAGLPTLGIENPTSWNFTTAVARTLTIAADPAPIGENGGTRAVTVTRNLGTTGPLVVTLASSDTTPPTIATMPSTVTILDGQPSVTFTVTALDDTNFDGLKTLRITATAPDFVSGNANISVADNETADVVVSEIMFNPGSANGNSGFNDVRREWVEVFNRGTTSVDLGGWSLDDEDTSNWGLIPDGTILPPGRVAVIYNSFFGANTDAGFRADWSIPAEALTIGVFWGMLDNSPVAVGATLNEVLVLRDASNTVIDQVNYDDDGTDWPAPASGNGGPSIALARSQSGNDTGRNWIRSAVGVRDAVAPTGTVFTSGIVDVGSPGRMPRLNSSVESRGLFYNNSTGNGGNAFATDKVPLVSGVSSFANYTNYELGLTGVAVDVIGLSLTITPAQMLENLVLRQWNGIDTAGFVALPTDANPTVLVTPRGGTGGSDRVGITFRDRTLRNTWLRIEVLANAVTGLATRDTFYFGNVVGEVNVGNTTDRLRVNAQDTGAIRDNQSTEPGSALVTNIYDLNRDGRVNAQDTSILRSNQETEGIVAPLNIAGTLNAGGGFASGAKGSSIFERISPLVQTDGNVKASGRIVETQAVTKNRTDVQNRSDVQLIVPTNVSKDSPVGDPTLPPISEKLPKRTQEKANELTSLDEYFSSFWLDRP